MAIEIDRPIGELLQEVRYLMSIAELKKTGFNKFGNFYYFELENFVPLATKLFYERKMYPVFNIEYVNDIEYATLYIYRGNEYISFKLPTAEAVNSQNPIQNQGSKVTYMRRYLYMMALDLVENDGVDAADNSKIKTTGTISQEQFEDLKRMYSAEDVKKMYKELGITKGTAIPVEFYEQKKKEHQDKLKKMQAEMDAEGQKPFY